MPDPSEHEEAQQVAEQLLDGRPPGDQVKFSLDGMAGKESEDHPFGVHGTTASKNDDGSVSSETISSRPGEAPPP